MKQQRRSELSLPVGLAAALVFAAASGCSSNNNNPKPGNDAGYDAGGGGGGGGGDGGTGLDGGSDGGTGLDGGTGTITKAIKVSNSPTDFYVPFDAIPSADAQTVYFLGVNPPTGAAVFSVPAAGGAVKVLTGGVPLSSPISIALSSDGTAVFAADPSGWTNNDKGAVFMVPAAGGTPTALAETNDYTPRVVVVSKQNNSDVLYFVGNDPADGMPGIFTDNAGTVVPILKGATLDPTALAVSSTGTVYYLDSAQTETMGNLFKVTSATAGTQIGAAQNLLTNYPGAMALSQDESAIVTPVIVPSSAAANAGGTNFARIDVTTGAVTLQSAGATTDPLVEPGGLHRALNSDTYSYVDLGANQSGTVYLLSK